MHCAKQLTPERAITHCLCNKCQPLVSWKLPSSLPARLLVQLHLLDPPPAAHRVQPTAKISHACGIAKSGKELVTLSMVRRRRDAAPALQQATVTTECLVEFAGKQELAIVVTALEHKCCNEHSSSAKQPTCFWCWKPLEMSTWLAVVIPWKWLPGQRVLHSWQLQRPCQPSGLRLLQPLSPLQPVATTHCM